MSSKPFHPIPDPETVRISHNVIKLLQVFGPLTLDLLQYNGACGSGTAVLSKLQQVLDVLVALGVIGVVAPSPPLPSAASPVAAGGVSGDAKAGGASSSGGKSGVAAAESKLQPKFKWPGSSGDDKSALNSGCKAPLTSSKAPKMGAESGAAAASVMTTNTSAQTSQIFFANNDDKEPSSGSGTSEEQMFLPKANVNIKRSTSTKTDGKSAGDAPGGTSPATKVPESSSKIGKVGIQPNIADRLKLQQRQQKPHQQRPLPKRQVRYVFLDGRPRADVVLPHELPARIREASNEKIRAQERVKLLRSELQLTHTTEETTATDAVAEEREKDHPKRKRSRPSHHDTKTKETLRLILRKYPEVMDDPVYVAGLRNMGFDLAFSEDKKKTKLSASREGIDRKREVEELLLAVGPLGEKK